MKPLTSWWKFGSRANWADRFCTYTRVGQQNAYVWPKRDMRTKGDQSILTHGVRFRFDIMSRYSAQSGAKGAVASTKSANLRRLWRPGHTIK
jgi:hypothetical protein